MATICNCSECEGKQENWCHCLGCEAMMCDMGQCGPEGWHYRNRDEGWYCPDCFYRPCDWEDCDNIMTLDAASKGKRFSLTRKDEEIEVCDWCVVKARAEGWGDEEDEEEDDEHND